MNSNIKAMSYTQNNEEAVITAYFTSNEGRLLDIGSHDGVRLSNSRRLIENGWSGVLVEPSPFAFVELLANTKQFPERVSLWNVAITSAPSPALTFNDSMGDFISSFDEGHLNKWADHPNWRKYRVKPVDIAELLEIEGTNFDFISIDVEGTNWNLLKALPNELLENAKMICIEYDNWMTAMKDYLSPFGFKVIHQNGENLIFVK